MFRSTAPPPAAPADTSSVKSSQPFTRKKAGGARAGEAVPPPPAAPAPAPPNFNWAGIESADFKQYIQNLRDLGVPEETIRDLVRAEITKLYRPKMLAVRPARSTNYWENGPYAMSRNQPSVEQRKQERALYKEQADLLKTLVGEAPPSTNSYVGRIFTNAPPEVQKQITELQMKMNEKQQALADQNGGVYDSSTMAGRRKAEREFYEELAKLVPADQVEQHKLRYSELSRNLREELRAFNPTEEEFKAILHQREAIDAARPATDIAALSDVQKATQLREAQLVAQKDSQAALVEALGPDRAKEYQLLKNDSGLQQLAQSGVPRESLLRVGEIKQTAEASVKTVRADTSLTPQQRSEALSAIRTETEKELAQLLGDRRARGYQNNGGYWIRNLSPQTITRPAAP